MSFDVRRNFSKSPAHATSTSMKMRRSATSPLKRMALVLDMNLTATRLLGIERTFLLKKPFSALIAPESQDTFYLHIRQVLRVPGCA